jgi:hypothetical protein
MFANRSSCAVVVLASCGSQAQVPDRTLAQDPRGAVTFFIECVRARKYDYAHLALSAGARRHVTQEALILAFESYPTARRLLGMSEVGEVRVEGEEGRAPVRVPAMGIEYELKVSRFTVGSRSIWTVDLSEGDLERLAGLGRKWLARQWEDGLGRTLFPPDPRPIPLDDPGRAGP